jgi:hypothetical protein
MAVNMIVYGFAAISRVTVNGDPYFTLFLSMITHSLSYLFQGPSVYLGYLFNNPRVYLKTAVSCP